MRRLIIGEGSFLLITAIYKLWSHWWIDDDTCRLWVTRIMQAATWLTNLTSARRGQPTERE